MTWKTAKLPVADADARVRSIEGAIEAGLRGLDPRQRAYVRAQAAETLAPSLEVRFGRETLTFRCPSRAAWHHVDGLARIEPETLAWIDRFRPEEIFWDVGAGVGVFSLYAARMRKTRVLAFEPSAASYAALSRNVEVNGLDDRVQAYCLAIARRSALGTLHLASTDAGAIFNTFGAPVDYRGNPFPSVFGQGSLGLSVDDLVSRFGALAPHHLKIDVDGIEPEILRGARATLSAARLRSVLIEVVSDERARAREIEAALADAGLTRFDDGGRRGEVPNRIFVRPDADHAERWAAGVEAGASRSRSAS